MKKINAIHESSKELNRTFRHFEKLAVLPEKLWYGLLTPRKDKFPKAHHHIFKIINGGMVVSEACAQLLQGFRLGETQLAPVRIYRLDNGEPLDERLYYFLNICEQRRYFRVDASDPAFKQIAHSYYQGQPRYYLKGKDIEHDAYALDKAALECDVDLWADPAFLGMIFVSPALREALREARMDKAWFLYRCQLV